MLHVLEAPALHIYKSPKDALKFPKFLSTNNRSLNKMLTKIILNNLTSMAALQLGHIAG